MKKTQTAIESLIKKLNEHKRQSAYNELGTNRTSEYRIGLSKAIEFCEEHLEMEKEQIMNAVYTAMGTNFDPNMGRAEQYYNETFKRQEP